MRFLAFACDVVRPAACLCGIRLDRQLGRFSHSSPFRLELSNHTRLVIMAPKTAKKTAKKATKAKAVKKVAKKTTTKKAPKKK